MKKRRLLSATMAFLVLVSTLGFTVSGLIFIPDDFDDFEVTEPWEMYDVFFVVTDENGNYVESGLANGTSELALTDENGRGITALNAIWAAPVTLQPQHRITFRPAHDARGWFTPANAALHWGFILCGLATVQIEFHRNTSPSILGPLWASAPFTFRGLRASVLIPAGHYSISIFNAESHAITILNFDAPWLSYYHQQSWFAFMR